MVDMTIERNKMPLLDPEMRAKSFSEVALGYTKEQAISEAKRCLGCKNTPCVSACPVKIRIPEFIKKVAEGDFDGAYKIIEKSSSLPSVCGRVCPQENQCEGKCVRGIKSESVAIGRLERFVADHHSAKGEKEERNIVKNGKTVAIVGSGPAGLTCAGDLAKKGYDVTVFEALHTPGGVLVYGIPEFRLPKAIVRKEIEELKDMGVKIETNVIIGKTLSVEELLEKFDSVFIGSGAGLPKFMNIKGENLKGVYSANEFLTRINLMEGYKENSATPVMKSDCVAVVGGGNVAMDAARCALRLGAKKVYIVYRRSLDELPARREEVEHAMEEGIEFKLLTNPVEILGDDMGWVSGIKCVAMELSEPDETGRRSPHAIEGSDFVIECNSVIMSIGTSPNPLIKSSTEGLVTDRRGGIVINDDTGLTSIEGVYAGGDAVTGAATVILAMGAGKLAAESIDEYLKEKHKKG